jgi:hypothetical protein
MSYWQESCFYHAQHNIDELRKACQKDGYEAEIVLLDRISELLTEFGNRTHYPTMTETENNFCHIGGKYGLVCSDGLACEERCAERTDR